MSTTLENPHAATGRQDGEPCAACGSPLAADQRYCLECGARRADARAPFTEALAAPAPAGEAPAPARGPSEISPATAALGVALAVLFLGVGVLVGRSGGGSGNAAAPAPSVVTVGGTGTGGPAAGASSTAAAFKSDWPAGQNGWTVQLDALPKASNDAAKVAAAKQAATGKGAPAVGALDSDQFKSLPKQQWIVYSGNFKSKAEATKALAKLRKSFPQAKVVQVSAGGAGPVISGAAAQRSQQQLQQLQNLSGSNYSKQSRKLAKTVPIPGRAPPTDNKAGGGGTGFQTIGP
jgi:cell division septation protein DedD